MNEHRIDLDEHHLTRLAAILFTIAILSVGVVAVVLLISSSADGATTPNPRPIVKAALYPADSGPSRLESGTSPR
jgi:hypothetical protein